MKLTKIVVFVISCCMLTVLYASDGTRNLLFNASGNATPPDGGGAVPGFWYIPTTGSYTAGKNYDVAMQGNKIILVGTVTITGQGATAYVTRLNSDGTIDTTFGTSGVTQINTAFFGGGITIHTSGTNEIYGVKVLSDYSILLACALAVTATTQRFSVVKMTFDGLRDTNFNIAPYSGTYGGSTPGIWYINSSPFSANSAQAWCVTVDSTGRILVGGYAPLASDSNINHILIVRLTSVGKLDTTFNASGAGLIPGMWYRADASGAAQTAYFTGQTFIQGARAIAIQPSDGSIFIATILRGGNSRFSVMKLTAGGFIDGNFNNSGNANYGGTIPGYYAIIPTVSNFTAGDGGGQSAILQSDKIIVGGYVNYSSGQCSASMRLTTTGVLDATYNTGGSGGAYGGTDSGFWVLTRGAPIANSFGNFTALTIDPSGKIIGSANLVNSGTPNFLKIAAIRLTSAGKLDTTFNAAGSGNPYGGNIPGIYYYPTNGTSSVFTGTQNLSSSLAVMDNGQLLIAGMPRVGAVDQFCCASVIDKIGILQDTASPFNTGSAGLIMTTTIDQSGKLLAGGNYGTKSQLTRYNVTGSPRDNEFNGDGVAYGDLQDTAIINKVINNGTGYLVAGVSGTNKFTTASFDNIGALNSGYGASGIVQETGIGISAAYDMLLNGTALAVSGYINSDVPTVINYKSTTGERSHTIGDNGMQPFSQLEPGVMYGISTTTGTQRYGAGQSNSIAFVTALTNTDGVLQDTAAPFNTGAEGLIYSTTITQTDNILAAVAYNSQWYVVNYTSAGVRDASFGLTSNGIAEAPGFSGSARPRAIAVDSTGRIIAAGTSVVSTYPVFTVVRYLADGTVDEVVQETSLTTETTPETSALGILVNDDDSITVAGNIVVDGQPVPIIIDYDSNMVQTNVRQFDALAPGYFFGVQMTDGKEYGAGASEDTALLFPLLDGTGLLQDTEAPFDGDHSGRIYSGCINENDIITLCGNFNNTWMVVQYTGVGERSIGFNSDGVVLESSLGTANAYAIIQDSSGNFYVAGESTVSGTTVLTVAKYNSAGALVTTFGTNGIIQETRFGQSRAFNLALNPNGSLLIAGQITVNGTLYAALLAYDISGQPITSFGVNGAQTYQAFGAGALYSTVVAPTYVATSAGQTGDVATLVQTSQDATADAYIHSGL